VSNVAKLDGFEVREYQVVMRGKRTGKAGNRWTPPLFFRRT